MKIIHNINTLATWATILLYISIFLGMYAQIVLGPLQLILATIVSIKYYKSLNKYHKNLVLYYWLAVVATLALAGFVWSTNFDNVPLTIGCLFIIPMSVACYFLYVTKKLNKYLNHEP